MTLYPGRRYVGDTVRLAVNWQNEDGTDIDPSTDVVLTVRSPGGTTTTSKYSLTEVTRENAGDYYTEMVPNESGRWHYQWQATGAGTSRVIQGSFVVQSDPFGDDPPSDYGR